MSVRACTPSLRMHSEHATFGSAFNAPGTFARTGHQETDTMRRLTTAGLTTALASTLLLSSCAT